MNAFRRLRFLWILIPLTGCTVFQTSTELHRGRVALLNGMPDAAVAHFTQVTELDGDVRYSQFREGAWTYLGRAYYDAKKYPEARQALEKAVAINSEDSFARLYLGLTLARQGNHESRQKEVLAGLKGLSDWLDYITYNAFTAFTGTRRDRFVPSYNPPGAACRLPTRIWIHCLPVSRTLATALSGKLIWPAEMNRVKECADQAMRATRHAWSG